MFQCYVKVSAVCIPLTAQNESFDQQILFQFSYFKILLISQKQSVHETAIGKLICNKYERPHNTNIPASILILELEEKGAAFAGDRFRILDPENLCLSAFPILSISVLTATVNSSLQSLCLIQMMDIYSVLSQQKGLHEKKEHSLLCIK